MAKGKDNILDKLDQSDLMAYAKEKHGIEFDEAETEESMRAWLKQFEAKLNG